MGNLAAARTSAARLDGARGYEPLTFAQMALAELHLAEGAAGPAVAHAREAVAVASGGDWLLLNADARLVLGRALAAAGELEAADQARAAVELYAAKGCLTGVAEAETVLYSLQPAPG